MIAVDRAFALPLLQATSAKLPGMRLPIQVLVSQNAVVVHSECKAGLQADKACTARSYIETRRWGNSHRGSERLTCHTMAGGILSGQDSKIGMPTTRKRLMK